RLGGGGGAEALLGPVSHAAAGELGVIFLPEEFAGVGVESHLDPAVGGNVGIARPFVVGADGKNAVGDDWVAVGQRSGLGGPEHIFARLDIKIRRRIFVRADHI